MKRRMTLVLTLLLLLGAVGCSGGWPFKWKPTEPQKQSADLTVSNLRTLDPHVAPAGKPLLAEALAGAEITQGFMGLPKVRPKSVAPANVATLQQAAHDAARPDPTIGQVGTAIVAEAEQVATTGFDLAELLLTAAGSIAGIWGLGKVKHRFDDWKGRAVSAETQTIETFAALREVVRSVDRLDDETKSKVKKVQEQTAGTEILVAEARRT